MSVRIENKEIEIIDCHVHTFPDKIAAAAIGQLAKKSGLIPCTDGTIGDTLKKLDSFKVDRACLLNIATTPKQEKTINDTVIRMAQQYSDIVIPFGSVHYDSPEALRELERLKAAGIKGIKLHPDYQNIMIDDERLFPIYEKCEELGLPIVFHAGFDCYSPELIHAPPAASLHVIERFRHLKVVLAHFGGLQCWDEVEKYLIGKNVWLDTAMCNTYSNQNQIERMIRNHDSSKILFGSDCPWENPSDTADFILGMDLSFEIKNRIFSKNAKELFKL